MSAPIRMLQRIVVAACAGCGWLPDTVDASTPVVLPSFGGAKAGGGSGARPNEKPGASGAGVTRTKTEPLWAENPPDFPANAALAGVPTVLYFTATWCGFCTQMDRTTLADAGVRTKLAAFKRVKIDHDAQPEWVARYQVRGVPAFVMVDERGEEIARLVGKTDEERFGGWLELGRARAVQLARAAARQREELRSLERLLSTEDEAAWRQNKGVVFALAGRGPVEARDFAVKHLTKRAEADPASVLEGLLDEDLAVRVVVAGVLRKRMGERFVFDPWAGEEERRTTLERMRAEMAGVKRNDGGV